MQPGGKILADQRLKTDGQPIELTVECKDGKYSFAYGFKGGKERVLASGIDASYTASSAGGFTGTTIGLFATSAEF